MQPQIQDGAAIFTPMLGMFVLTFVVWSYMYARRIPFILRESLTPEQTTPLGFMQISPPEVSNPSDNLKNLFEVPVIFYALCLYLYVIGQVDDIYVGAAWVFFGFRVLHSLMHCTMNIVIVRFWLHAASTLSLVFMIVRALLAPA